MYKRNIDAKIELLSRCNSFVNKSLTTAKIRVYMPHNSDSYWINVRCVICKQPHWFDQVNLGAHWRAYCDSAQADDSAFVPFRGLSHPDRKQLSQFMLQFSYLVRRTLKKEGLRFFL